ncbi:MAG TPA: nickel pincer cofactor biosynthesis protein LarC [Gemmatimonadaceae bacterium]|nr:nickel pincer cofactor biosynthesis protein LarC [Gemmatimonadaceae bacterium]
MKVGILDPFSGISGDMTLGALLDVGLDPEWLRALPGSLGLEGIGVRIADVKRGEIACKKVDFDIPDQPHGRHLKQLQDIVTRSAAPAVVKEQANRAFTLIAEQEAAIHATTVERVHLHEVGAVDAILDIVGGVWGFELLGVERVYCGAIATGDGVVSTAHGALPVPAPATLRLLEGHTVRPGPEGAGELVTPTGAALVRVLSSGPPPREYVPLRSGFGAGTKEFQGRANALRLIVAEHSSGDGAGTIESLVQLTSDIDDMTPEYLAATAELLREAGALDVVLVSATMKRGRPGTRIEVLARPAQADALEELLLRETTTIGVRRWGVERRALPRESRTVEVLGHLVAIKVVRLPDGSMRAKPEFSDVQRVAQQTGRPLRDIFLLAADQAERQ